MNIDPISWKIINIVQADGRISLKAIAAEIGLSLPATSERLKRLEEAGIISGYQAIVKPYSIGYQLTALIQIRALKQDAKSLTDHLSGLPEVIECLRLTGENSYQIKVVATDMNHLEHVINPLCNFGEVSSSVVLSQPIPLRPASQPKLDLYAVK